jgi:hypothetical protein
VTRDIELPRSTQWRSKHPKCILTKTSDMLIITPQPATIIIPVACVLRPRQSQFVWANSSRYEDHPMLLGYGKYLSIDALCLSFQSECHKVPIQHRFASNQVPSWHSILAVLYLLQQRRMSLVWLVESARHAICQGILLHLARELMLKHRSTLQRKRLLGRRGTCV